MAQWSNFIPFILLKAKDTRILDYSYVKSLHNVVFSILVFNPSMKLLRAYIVGLRQMNVAIKRTNLSSHEWWDIWLNILKLEGKKNLSLLAEFSSWNSLSAQENGRRNSFKQWPML